jgi:hypothetical protein
MSPAEPIEPGNIPGAPDLTKESSHLKLRSPSAKNATGTVLEIDERNCANIPSGLPNGQSFEQTFDVRRGAMQATRSIGASRPRGSATSFVTVSRSRKNGRASPKRRPVQVL